MEGPMASLTSPALHLEKIKTLKTPDLQVGDCVLLHVFERSGQIRFRFERLEASQQSDGAPCFRNVTMKNTRLPRLAPGDRCIATIIDIETMAPRPTFPREVRFTTDDVRKVTLTSSIVEVWNQLFVDITIEGRWFVTRTPIPARMRRKDYRFRGNRIRTIEYVYRGRVIFRKRLSDTPQTGAHVRPLANIPVLSHQDYLSLDCPLVEADTLLCS